MNYKLEKQLKEAGFESKDSALVGRSKPDKDGYVVPTLSELIEATKQKGRCLKLEECQQWWGHVIDKKTNLYKKDKKGKFIKRLIEDYRWEAKMIDWDSKEYGKRHCYETGDEVVTLEKGETLEVAVVKLWLKSNKKQ